MIKSKEAWALEARNVLRSLIVRNGITYDQLAERLKAIGVNETVSSVKGKVHRGTFSFVFVMQVMQVLDKTRLNIE